MLPALKSYLVREHVGMFKLQGTYDVFNPETGEQIAIAQEKKGTFNAIMGFFINKRMLPTKIDIHEGKDINGPIAFTMKRGFSFFRPKVEVLGPDGVMFGYFQTRLLTIGGKFGVFDASGKEVALVKGNWLSWNFKFTTSAGVELGLVTRQWSGIGKELFTSADNYIINVHNPDPAAATLLLAAGLAIDTVYKEDAGGGGLSIGE
jgi:uncharacterized protein YxjI